MIGNPPYGADTGAEGSDYLRNAYTAAGREVDTYALFMEQSVKLSTANGFISMIVPTGWYSGARYPALRRFIATHTFPKVFINLPYDVFVDAWVDTTVFAVQKRTPPVQWPPTESHDVVLKTFEKRHSIESSAEFSDGGTIADVAGWFADGDDTFLTYANAETTRLLKRLQKEGVPFSTYADIQRGVTPFHLSETKDFDTSRRAFAGIVRRYILDHEEVRYVRFDDTLMEPKPERYFVGPRLLIRELISRQFQVQAVLATDNFVTNKSMQSALALKGGPNLRFLLGCFNSKLLSWYFLQKSNIAQRDDFPKIVLKETRSLPFPRIDLKIRAERILHDRLVTLVDKMLILTPQLRAEPDATKRDVLQNAVTAADDEIDALVYKLYGLSPEEIALVEAAPAT